MNNILPLKRRYAHITNDERAEVMKEDPEKWEWTQEKWDIYEGEHKQKQSFMPGVKELR